MLANPVFRIDLADYATERNSYDSMELDRQMRWALGVLPPGSNVRFIVHKYTPAGDPLGWMRPDLILQVEASDATNIAAWMNALNQEEAAA
ncbi:hypothetical protein QF015_002180 [Paenarthrobacter sp. TE4293]|uniref:hypothetical protein n=1 Tax=Paenarthrobacter sp. TE4293 TaxID=3381695 RepID=UPI003D1A9463